jgi:hypothetical protein
VLRASAFAQKLNQGGQERVYPHVLPDRHHSDTLELFLAQSEDTEIVTRWLSTVDGH